MHRYYFLPFVLLIAVQTWSQNTIGALLHLPDQSEQGYNLIYPNNQAKAFLIDGCGRIVNTWHDNEIARPGAVVYLLEDGSLLRAKTDANLQDPTFGAGGAGGTIEIVDWNSAIKWRMIIADSIKRSHHDVHPMPNGNILAIVWERKLYAEIIEIGFDTSQYFQTELWPDAIYEIDTQSHEVVWSWHVWDHLIQDYDSTKQNFGIVSENPQRLDLNYQEYSAGRSDWIHANSLDYNIDRDQIVMTSKLFNEIWIIDHSTTLQESSSSHGGKAGRGGDLLFRWGNNEAFDQGDELDRILFQPHDAKWIQNEVSETHPWRNSILFFNNFIVPSKLSLGQMITPVFDSLNTKYHLENEVYLPQNVTETFIHPDSIKGYSAIASSIQLLGNGNILMCAAQPGFSYELNKNGEVVWEYKTPLIDGFPVPQGTNIALSRNFTNQITRYPLNYSAFMDKELQPKGFIELEPDMTFCDISSSSGLKENEPNALFYPNPTSGEFIIATKVYNETPFEIFNYLGNLVQQGILNASSTVHPIQLIGIPSGVYYLKILGKTPTIKFVLITE